MIVLDFLADPRRSLRPGNPTYAAILSPRLRHPVEPRENKGGGAFNTGPLDAGPEQGGSNLGGLGATGAIDRDRDPEAEGFIVKKPATRAREAAVIEEESDEIKPDGGS